MAGTAFITGTDKGLGRVLLNTFLVRGYRVFAGRYSEQTRYGDSMSIGGNSLVIVPLDVTNLDSVEAAAGAVEESAGSIDILINNAGVDAPRREAVLEKTDIEDIIRILNVNSLGPLRMAKRFLPLLKKGNGKLIINITSEAARLAECSYTSGFGICMSKAALNIQSRILQNYLAGDGIKVLAVHPGWMQTDMGGANADVPPIESARGIYELSQRKWKADDPVFMTYTGKTINW